MPTGGFATFRDNDVHLPIRTVLNFDWSAVKCAKLYNWSSIIDEPYCSALNSWANQIVLNNYCHIICSMPICHLLWTFLWCGNFLSGWRRPSFFLFAYICNRHDSRIAIDSEKVETQIKTWIVQLYVWVSAASALHHSVNVKTFWAEIKPAIHIHTCMHCVLSSHVAICCNLQERTELLYAD